MEPNKNRLTGFAPVFSADSKMLILGSMPGEESLRLGQYYANPRNAFWRIIAKLTGNESELPYERRLKMLDDQCIALWDVLHSCRRSGSLDSAIETSSAKPNDFDSFLTQNPRIRCIYFNGAFAENCYRKNVLPNLPPQLADIPILRLPSTSPANASLGFEAKLRAWQAIFE
ncbi:MAG: DNA-deoxyinosine glycosylase [Arenimonas sp.]